MCRGGRLLICGRLGSAAVAAAAVPCLWACILHENLSSCSFPGYAAPLHTLPSLPLLPLCLAYRHSAFGA